MALTHDRRIATDPATSAETLARLAKHRDADVRESVALHPNATAKLLARLSKDRDWQVRSAAVRHPAIAPEVVATRENDREVMVQFAVLESPSAPADVITRLMRRLTSGENGVVYETDDVVLTKSGHLSILETPTSVWVVRLA